MFGKGLLKGLGITAKHTFEREITQQYPEERPHLQDRFRGSLAYDYPKCIACGLCIKACPNNVLTLETYKDEGSRKKKVAYYAIDLQYCLFCNLCVEICPTATLYFTHEFELTSYDREGIKKEYHRPPELVPASKTAAGPAEEDKTPPGGETDDKKVRQMEAMKTALLKNPAKTLGKILPAEEDVAIMSSLMQEDDKILTKLAQLLVEDRDKAAKVATAWVKKGRSSGPPPGAVPPMADGTPRSAAGQSSAEETAPPAADSREAEGGVGLPAEDKAPLGDEADDKRVRQVEALKTALLNNPAKTLGKILPAEEDVVIMSGLMKADDKILAKLTQLLVEDRDKAAKVATAWVAREKKRNPGEGGPSS
ncbi:MAG: NADH-quinone oxidoreductase subunit I [Syntrophomonadaceae bacterium]|nr:NADH-quinone oxidoreductase subunit I [Syntrophomonadaceae bacterium]